MDFFRLQPAYQSYIWGGERIRTYFDREIPAGRYAESWEVSDREEGMSFIQSGPWKGRSLKEIFSQKGASLLGRKASRFPLLVKIIDAKEHLSLQVHPDEDDALRLKAEPKSEAWIAVERSSVYVGFKPGVSQDDFLAALHDGSVVSLLEQRILERGESIYIPAGTVHAICKDSLLLEVQQNSNTTYRLYDWGRVGRALHLEEGLSCIDWEKRKPKVNRYFSYELISVRGSYRLPSLEKNFQVLFCLDGRGRIEEEEIRKGDTVLVSAGCSSLSLSGYFQLMAIMEIAHS